MNLKNSKAGKEADVAEAIFKRGMTDAQIDQIFEKYRQNY